MVAAYCYCLVQTVDLFAEIIVFELLMQKHDRAYSVCKFRKKYVCDNEI